MLVEKAQERSVIQRPPLIVGILQNSHKVILAAAMIAIPPLFLLYELTCFVQRVAKDRFSKMALKEAEAIAQSRGLSSLLEKVKKLEGIDCNLLIHRLAQCSLYEKEIFDTLENFEVSDKALKEIFSGAHIVLKDGGETAKKWQALTDEKGESVASPSFSSHPSSGPQFRLHGNLVQECLFSTQKIDGEEHTWFQLEKNPLTWGRVLPHTNDFLQYKISGRNQGPCGSSAHTHHCSLVLHKKKSIN